MLISKKSKKTVFPTPDPNPVNGHPHSIFKRLPMEPVRVPSDLGNIINPKSGKVTLPGPDPDRSANSSSIDPAHPGSIPENPVPELHH
jgi:hypothetical protein